METVSLSLVGKSLGQGRGVVRPVDVVGPLGVVSVPEGVMSREPVPVRKERFV